MNSMLTLEEVKNYLEIDQNRIEGYIRERKLQAYKIGGTYVRFRKEEVLDLRSKISSKLAKKSSKSSNGFTSKVYDFWRFNNFYIFAILCIAALAIYVAKN